METNWKIRIAGYGTFDFTGTEEEAEEMRAHKSQFERGAGIKWRTENQTVIDKLYELEAWFFDRGKGCPSWVSYRIKKEKQKVRGGA